MTRRQHRDRDDYPTYRTSPLSHDLGSRRNPVRAGDAAPDGPLGNDTRLFDLFRGPHFTVLTFGNRSATTVEAAHLHAHTVLPAGSAAPAEACIDTTGLTHRGYGARNGTLVIVRPDGYVGLVAHDPRPDTLRNYLAQVRLLPLPAPGGAPAARP
ncbi:hypothetical protein MXD59_06630 [Frankia sp. Ag45/Mut15]|uniref:Monooxygenase n=1 Tax=Frankia umida TaxID=573489 RepID=A0ABT0JVK7_9ACTN|nr:hypothetical protein [Frankia umida]MCK9875455.1 hypothetical protein [Frankia umida]